MAKKPLVATGIRTEFGEVYETPEFYDQLTVQQDHTYVPGFSQMRRARDIALKEVADGKRDQKDVPALPVNCRWVRCAKPLTSAPDDRKQITSESIGYRLVSKEDLGQPWFSGMPLGAVEGPGGTIRKGDTVLMVATKERAAMNAAAKARRTERMTSDAPSTALKALGDHIVGSDPWTETTKADHTITVGSSLGAKKSQ